MQGSGDHRRGSMPRSYTATSEYHAQNERFGIRGIFKAEEQSNDISKIWEI